MCQMQKICNWVGAFWGSCLTINTSYPTIFFFILDSIIIMFFKKSNNFITDLVHFYKLALEIHSKFDISKK